jgi:uncharacterized DUF497 family protein
MVNFEYDEEKSCLNKDKHGINFEEAQWLWRDDYRVEVDLATDPEPRYSVTGIVGGIFFTAIVTYRSDNIRIISVRRARKTEVQLYERQKNQY